MLLPDINILLYAHNTSAPEHVAARGWWENTLRQDLTIGLPWVVILGFIRLTTNRKMFPLPMHVKESLGHVRT